MLIKLTMLHSIIRCLEPVQMNRTSWYGFSKSTS